jgi:REP element-mobilizing transposase RayT
MPGELDETRPHSITEVAGRVMLEPISPGLYNLTYACLLVPRFSSHYLTGDMADRLSEWLPQICIAFGWRLEYLAVRPEYIQWVLNVPPATSPGYLMRIIRQQTSEKIFHEFPKLKKENPSGDFWAPGYLIMGGAQPHPPQLVKDYIKQTRTRQGYSTPRNNIPSR